MLRDNQNKNCENWKTIIFHKKKEELKQIKEDGSKASHMVKIGGKKERKRSSMKSWQ